MSDDLRTSGAAEATEPASFPERPIRAVRTGTTPPVAQLVLALFFVVLAVGGGAWTWSSIGPDLAINANPVTIADGDVSGSCRVKKLAFADCAVTMTYTVDNQTHVVSRDYFWVDVSKHEYETDIVVAADDPSNATASVALEKLPNRVLTAIGMVGMFLVIAAFPFQLFRRSRRARAAYDAPQPLRFVPVPVLGVQDVLLRGKAYRFQSADGQGPKHTSLITSKEVAPYRLPDGRLLTAVAHGQDPILLDHHLTRLDLTDAERTQVNAAAAGLVTAPASPR